MKNPKLCALLAEAVMEERNYKICLVEDIMKVKRTLFGLGKVEHDEFILPETEVNLFNYLYDLDIPTLEFLLNNYSKQATLLANNRIKELA